MHRMDSPVKCPERDVPDPTPGFTVSATDLVTLAGLNPHRPPVAVLLRKWKEVERPAGPRSAILQSGIDIEPITITRWLRAHPGLAVIEPTRSYCHERFTWQSARPDGLVYRAADIGVAPGYYPVTDRRKRIAERAPSPLVVVYRKRVIRVRQRPLGVIECKARSYWEGRSAYRRTSTGQDDREILPPRDYVQTHYTMDVLGVERGWFAAIWDTHQFSRYVLTHDTSEALTMRRIAWAWLKQYIEPHRVPGTIYRHLTYGDVLHARHALQTQSGYLIPDVETEALIGQLRALDARQRYLADTRSHLENAIRARIGDSQGIASPSHGRITWNNQPGRISSNDVIAELAEALGMDDDAITRAKNRHRGKTIRSFRVPSRKWKETPYEPTEREHSERESAIAAAEHAAEHAERAAASTRAAASDSATDTGEDPDTAPEKGSSVSRIHPTK